MRGLHKRTSGIRRGISPPKPVVDKRTGKEPRLGPLDTETPYAYGPSSSQAQLDASERASVNDAQSVSKRKDVTERPFLDRT